MLQKDDPQMEGMPTLPLLKKRRNSKSVKVNETVKQRRKRNCVLYVISFLFLILVTMFLVGIFHSRGILEFSYIPELFRPLWDKPTPSRIKKELFNYGWQGEQSCALHGFKPRSKPARVFAGFIFSTELDLLALRLIEHEGVIDKYVLVESEETFTKIEKPTMWSSCGKEQARFKRFLPKIHSTVITKKEIEQAGDPFNVEALHRRRVLEIYLKNGLKKGDVIITGDLDEIPSLQTIQLLKHCEGWGPAIQLSLPTYEGSFEFKSITPPNIRLGAREYDPKIKNIDWIAHHTLQSDTILLEAGWHCSWCFRYMNQYLFKMKSWSHADSGVVDDARIQDRLCGGRNIMGGYHDMYSFSEVIHAVHMERSPELRRLHTAANLPIALQTKPHEFPHLLPGGCKREMKSEYCSLK